MTGDRGIQDDQGRTGRPGTGAYRTTGDRGVQDDWGKGHTYWSKEGVTDLLHVLIVECQHVGSVSVRIPLLHELKVITVDNYMG